jgi:hypothetical protein
MIYQDGVGVKKDKTKAWELMKKAAEKKSAEAQYTLAVWYRYVHMHTFMHILVHEGSGKVLVDSWEPLPCRAHTYPYTHAYMLHT